MHQASLYQRSFFLLLFPQLALLALLQGCASASRSSQNPPPVENIAIMTTSLPSGQINVAYSASLAATGGTTPLTWALTSGTLPSGLLLSASTGAISGTPMVSGQVQYRECYPILRYLRIPGEHSFRLLLRKHQRNRVGSV